jgi:uncharacterized protein YutE (UPF0331/DUF86 family)
MSKKRRTNLKLELAKKERGRLLQIVEEIDAVLSGKVSTEEAHVLFNKLTQQAPFEDAVSWIQPLIESYSSDIEARLQKFADSFNRKFPSSYSVDNRTDEERDKYFRRIRAATLIKLQIDSSVLLYVLGRNGAAIIELHAIVERAAIEALSQQILLPDKIDIGLKLVERLTLPDISALLRDCSIIDNDDVKFAQSLNKLRNGLAHRNTKVLSRVVYSGRKLSDAEIDFVMEDVDYISLAVGSVGFLLKITKWDDLDESEQVS